MNDKASIWNSAGKAGLALGGVSAAYLLIVQLLSKIPEPSLGLVILINVSTTILWAAKLFFCIYLMKVFMKKYAATDPEIDNSRTFRFGTLAALFSALIYAAAYMAYITFIDPDIFAQSLDILRDNPMMDSATLEAVEEMIPSMPTYAFFGNLIYCTLYGTIVSAILSRNIPSSNPFENQQ